MKVKQFILVLLLMTSGLLGVNQIPSSQIVDWSESGLVSAITCDTIITVNNETQLYAAVNNKPLNKTACIELSAGSYNLINSLVLKSGTVLKGISAENTILNFSSQKGIIIGNSDTSSDDTIAVSSGLTKGSTTLNLASSSGLSAGDILILSVNSQSVHNHVLDAPDLNSCIYHNERFVGQVIRIQTVNSSSIIFDDPLHMDFSDFPDPTVVRIAHPTINVGVENLKITGSDCDWFIWFNRAHNCYLKDIETYQPDYMHIYSQYSSHLEISGSYIHDAIHFGDASGGYGVSLGFLTTSCKIEDNQFEHLRHAMIVHGGANGNVFGYNRSWDQYSLDTSGTRNFIGDIDLHGHYPFANLFEGNICERIDITDWYGASGPYNTFFRNNTVPRIDFPDSTTGFIMQWAADSEFRDPNVTVKHSVQNIVFNQFNGTSYNQTTFNISDNLDSGTHYIKNNKAWLSDTDYQWKNDSTGTDWPDSYYRNAAPDFLGEWPNAPFGRYLHVNNLAKASATNLGGTLNLQIHNEANAYNGLHSGAGVLTETGNIDVDVSTNHEILKEKKHNNWDDQSNLYLMNNDNYRININKSSINAVYDTTFQITIDNSSDQVQFCDPWYVRPDGSQTGTDWIAVSGSYDVFLNQNPDQGPHYSLKAPRYYADTEHIYELNGWVANPTNDAQFIPTDDPATTNVVFKKAGVTVSPRYVKLNTIPNYTLTINQTLSIPAGAHIQCASGFSIVLDGGQLEVTGIGTATLTSSGPSVVWNGLMISPWSDYSYSIENLNIENAVTGIEFILPSPVFGLTTSVTYRNLTFRNCSSGLIFTEYSIPETDNGQILIDRCAFENVDETVRIPLSRKGLRISLSENTFIANGSNSAVSFYNDASSDSVASFHRILITDNTISGYAAGISFDKEIRFIDDQIGDWNDSRRTIEIADNLITNCGAGIRYHGQAGLFLHHNVLNNNDTCIVMKYRLPDSNGPSGNPSYRLVNNTYLQSDIGIYRFPYSKTKEPILMNWFNITGSLFSDVTTAIENGQIFDNYGFAYNIIVDDGTIPWITDSDQNKYVHDAGIKYLSNGDYQLRPYVQYGAPNRYKLNPVINAGLPDYDLDGISYVSDPDDRDPDGTRMDAGAHYIRRNVLPVSPAHIGYQPLSWIIIDDDVIVPTKGLLNIGEGSLVEVAGGARLSVAEGGSLTVEGSASEPVIFRSDSAWHGIRLDEGCETDLQHLQIENAHYGLNVNGYRGDISHISVRNCNYGIYTYNYNGTLDGISADSCTYGIYVNGQSPVIKNSIFTNCEKGVSAVNNASPSLATSRLPGLNTTNNVFTGNLIAIANDRTSALNAGIHRTLFGTVYGGFNNLAGNSTPIHNTSASDVRAEVNHWSLFSNYGKVDYSPTVQQATGLGLSKSNNESSLPESHLAALDLELTGDNASAAAAYLALLPDSDEKPWLLRGLRRAALNAGDTLTAIAALEMLSLPDALDDGYRLGIIGELYTLQNRHPEALAAFEEGLARLSSLASDESDSLASWLAFNRLMLPEQSFSKSSAETDFLVTYRLSEAARLYAELTGIELPDAPEILLPESYTLYPAYPNPFNPVTTLSYDLPEKSDVTLAIFNIQGQEIHRQQWQNQPAGHYHIQWNGSRHATGVYFVRLSAADFNQTRKMIYLK
jgi:tetratricopeptide (TPR) repeat protein